MERRNKCNICHGTSLKTIYKYDTYCISKCKNCDTLCRDEIFNRSESEKLYTKDYFCDFQKDFFLNNEKLRKKAFHRKIEAINKLYPSKGRLLDVGCAMGTFLEVARDKKWDVEGVELSKWAADYAREKRKLTVFKGDLSEMSYPSNSFDVITMWDVVDHSEFPNELVQEVYRILKPGGLFALDTFMDDALLFTLTNYLYKLSFGIIKKPSQYAHPIHHSHHFSTKTIKYLLGSNGFDIIFQKSSNLEGAVVSLGTVGKKVLSIFNFISRFIGKEIELYVVSRKI